VSKCDSKGCQHDCAEHGCCHQEGSKLRCCGRTKVCQAAEQKRVSSPKVPAVTKKKKRTPAPPPKSNKGAEHSPMKSTKPAPARRHWCVLYVLELEGGHVYVVNWID
jgi:hypothetical protein